METVGAGGVITPNTPQRDLDDSAVETRARDVLGSEAVSR